MIRALLVAMLAVLPASASAQSLSEMAGQMIIVGFGGDSVDDAGVAAARAQIASGQIGGVMYLRTNVASLPLVDAMNAAFTDAATGPLPFITLDQEGGQVERLTEAVGFGEIPSPRNVAAQGLSAAEAIYADLAQRIAAHGFTVNFGPVVDLELNPNNPVIARFGRAYSADVATVTAFGAAFVNGHRQAGIATSLKHFPGHGSSLGDTHDGFVDITDVWSPDELLPFEALIDAGLADMVMVAHVYHADYDGGAELPASLSPEWIEGVLRGQLGYTGVVVSDDMEMGAIRQRFDLHDTVVRAVDAGNDLLLFSNTAAADPQLGAQIHAILVAEAQSDPEFADRIAASYGRIMALKAQLGLVR